MEVHRGVYIFLRQLRRSARRLCLSLAALTALLFLGAGDLLAMLQAHLEQTLYFFSVAGPFLAHVKVAFFGALYLLMPLVMYVLWQALGAPFGIRRRVLLWYVAATCALFYAGTVFCYLVTLPYGVAFLLGFQSEDLKAVISVGRFVNFVTIFILAFGTIFELPVFMVFAARLGVSRRVFERNRRWAVLIIAILAALLTPTPDVVNMGLMAGPLYALYESGILVIRLLRLDARRTGPGGAG